MSTLTLRAWIDEVTGREVRQLTAFPGGANLNYFRYPRHLPNGLMLGRRRAKDEPYILIDPESGEVRPLAHQRGHYLKMRNRDGLLWTLERDTRRVWATHPPDGEPALVGQAPPVAELPGH